MEATLGRRPRRDHGVLPRSRQGLPSASLADWRASSVAGGQRRRYGRSHESCGPHHRRCQPSRSCRARATRPRRTAPAARGRTRTSGRASDHAHNGQCEQRARSTRGRSPREVEELSRGRLQIRFENSWGQGRDGNAEVNLIRDVQAGKADLGWVGSRAFDLVGVRAFGPLHAPDDDRLVRAGAEGARGRGGRRSDAREPRPAWPRRCRRAAGSAAAAAGDPAPGRPGRLVWDAHRPLGRRTDRALAAGARCAASDHRVERRIHRARRRRVARDVYRRQRVQPRGPLPDRQRRAVAAPARAVRRRARHAGAARAAAAGCRARPRPEWSTTCATRTTSDSASSAART